MRKLKHAVELVLLTPVRKLEVRKWWGRWGGEGCVGGKKTQHKTHQTKISRNSDHSIR